MHAEPSHSIFLRYRLWVLVWSLKVWSLSNVEPVGTEIVVDVERVGHGGFCVARHEGRAVFVRHSLPGERVRARITEGTEGARYWRADAVEVLVPSPDRVRAPCPYAGPGRCGGCDWQHVDLPAQRRLKASVVAEQLARLAGLTLDVEVEPPSGAVPDDDGLGWRTRVAYAVDAEDRAGLRRHRSHDVVPIDECLIAHPDVRSIGVEARRWPGVDSVEAIVSGSGDRLVIAEPGQLEVDLPTLPDEVAVATTQDRGGLTPVHGAAEVTERAGGRRWRVNGSGFWQVHPDAAETLARAVLEALAPQPGERALDLYSGVGLFAGVLAEQVGADGLVTAVESDRRAVDDARHNLRDLSNTAVVAGNVERVLVRDSREREERDGRAGAGRGRGPGSRRNPRDRRGGRRTEQRSAAPDRQLDADIVVLDPPRAGAKLTVVTEIVQRAPRAVGYVACDPAALARDVAAFASHGYELTSLRAFDLFPMTHHVECVALLQPSSGG
ncbi:class I SAM-dependent RNA methyltransferase [Phytoactinopolyspora endophytica]|uniref:class I SAM-dependent RNA methyltransferase n=1 Tax=Phytoactinopolyspora endophytica TaxID=1642495 RepID=UPI00197C7096|nr:class I SAM-dependent RNA methyltransferase [Phytoactinopolyspora endophytica]